VTAIDRGLLAGLRFECRPDCGLCCYATPAVSLSERTQLLQIAPWVDTVPGEDGFEFIPAREGGGACALLQHAACSAHAARPYPCRVYPLVLHVGTRVQAAPVLTCPGLELEGWARAERSAPSGLDDELATAEAELARSPADRWIADHRATEESLARRLRARGRWEAPERIRAEWRRDLPVLPPPVGTFRAPDPGAELEELPIAFIAGHGVTLLRSADASSRYEALAGREEGGVRESLGVFEITADPRPAPGEPAIALDRYLHHLIESDHFLWAAYHELRSGADDPLRDRLLATLSETRSEALRRGAIFARLHGEGGDSLDLEATLAGLRWMDAELLDRPTLGRVL
jgi:Fe-S-cluster containining protein